METPTDPAPVSSPDCSARDVFDWTRDLSEEILVQRARVVLLTDKPGFDEAVQRLESLESLLKESMIAHNAQLKKLRANDADRTVINATYHKLESLKSRFIEVIIAQIARVRKLRTDRASEFEIEEAVKRLESLKADYKAATGSECEWSEVREEGPILLTTNKVRGRELLPELRERLKELIEGKVIR